MKRTEQPWRTIRTISLPVIETAFSIAICCSVQGALATDQMYYYPSYDYKPTPTVPSPPPPPVKSVEVPMPAPMVTAPTAPSPAPSSTQLPSFAPPAIPNFGTTLPSYLLPRRVVGIPAVAGASKGASANSKNVVSVDSIETIRLDLASKAEGNHVSRNPKLDVRAQMLAIFLPIRDTQKPGTTAGANTQTSAGTSQSPPAANPPSSPTGQSSSPPSNQAGSQPSQSQSTSSGTNATNAQTAEQRAAAEREAALLPIPDISPLNPETGDYYGGSYYREGASSTATTLQSRPTEPAPLTEWYDERGRRHAGPPPIEYWFQHWRDQTGRVHLGRPPEGSYLDQNGLIHTGELPAGYWIDQARGIYHRGTEPFQQNFSQADRDAASLPIPDISVVNPQTGDYYGGSYYRTDAQSGATGMQIQQRPVEPAPLTQWYDEAGRLHNGEPPLEYWFEHYRDQSGRVHRGRPPEGSYVDQHGLIHTGEPPEGYWLDQARGIYYRGSGTYQQNASQAERDAASIAIPDISVLNPATGDYYGGSYIAEGPSSQGTSRPTARPTQPGPLSQWYDELGRLHNGPPPIEYWFQHWRDQSGTVHRGRPPEGTYLDQNGVVHTGALPAGRWIDQTRGIYHRDDTR